MDVQSTDRRRVPAPQDALTRERIESLWRRLDEVHSLRAVSTILSPDELGEVLGEVERLKGELRAARQLRHQADGEEQLVAPRACLAALLLLARSVTAYREAQAAWLSRRVSHAEPLRAYEVLQEALGLCDRVLRGAPWPSLQRLGLEALREVAQGGAVA